VLCIKANSCSAIVIVCAVLLIDIASVSSAQQPPSANRQEIERLRDYLDPLRRSRLVGSNDSLAIEMPDGKLSSVARSAGCTPPLSRGGLIQVDCAGLEDGVVYYFDESTRAMIEVCGTWSDDQKRCPPPQWPIEVPDCDGAVPQSITSAWRFYALPGSDGFYPVTAGWSMTLDDDSLSFDFYGVANVVRSYTAVATGDGRYALEIKDARSATTAIQVELAQCGMIVEADGVCDAFCQNLAEEIGTPPEEDLRTVVRRSLGDNVDEATVDRILADAAKARPQQPQTVFPERAFLRQEAAAR
jgi:hypothetical protein